MCHDANDWRRVKGDGSACAPFLMARKSLQRQRGRASKRHIEAAYCPADQGAQSKVAVRLLTQPPPVAAGQFEAAQTHAAAPQNLCEAGND